MIGWERLHKHKEQRLLLSVYVDDSKLGGRKENMTPMCTSLRRHLVTDSPVNLRNYVACDTPNAQYHRPWCTPKRTSTTNSSQQKRQTTLWIMMSVAFPDQYAHGCVLGRQTVPRAEATAVLQALRTTSGHAIYYCDNWFVAARSNKGPRHVPAQNGLLWNDIFYCAGPKIG